MGPIIKNLRLELCIILSIMLIAIISGSQDGKNIINADIGGIISAIGMLWMVGSVFRLYEEMSHKVISFFCGLFVFIFGHSLNEYGIFSALIFIGSIALFLAYMLNLVVPYVAKILFVSGLACLFFGFSFRGFDVPTSPDKYHQPVTYVDSKWDLNILYDDKNGKQQYKTISNIQGTEEHAYKAAMDIVPEWKDNNRGTSIKEIQVNLDYSSCPEEYRVNYCPTHSLAKKYPLNRRAKWSSFYSLLDTK